MLATATCSNCPQYVYGDSRHVVIPDIPATETTKQRSNSNTDTKLSQVSTKLALLGHAGSAFAYDGANWHGALGNFPRREDEQRLRQVLVAQFLTPGLRGKFGYDDGSAAVTVAPRKRRRGYAMLNKTPACSKF